MRPWDDSGDPLEEGQEHVVEALRLVEVTRMSGTLKQHLVRAREKRHQPVGLTDGKDTILRAPEHHRRHVRRGELIGERVDAGRRNRHETTDEVGMPGRMLQAINASAFCAFG